MGSNSVKPEKPTLCTCTAKTVYIPDLGIYGSVAQSNII